MVRVSSDPRIPHSSITRSSMTLMATRMAVASSVGLELFLSDCSARDTVTAVELAKAPRNEVSRTPPRSPKCLARKYPMKFIPLINITSSQMLNGTSTPHGSMASWGKNGRTTPVKINNCSTPRVSDTDSVEIKLWSSCLNSLRITSTMVNKIAGTKKLYPTRSPTTNIAKADSMGASPRRFRLNVEWA